MQFLLIIAHDDKFRASPELIASIYRWIDEYSRRGVRVRGAPLKPSREATTIQVREGVLSRKLGPFGNSADQIAAFELIECADLEGAVAIAASHPMAAAASIEVRPVWSELSDRTSHIPDGWPALIPRICVDDPEGLVGFVQQVFGAVGPFHPERPSELRIGESLLMVGSTLERRAMPAFLYVYVEDTDAAYRRALDRGAESLEEPQDMPYGDRRAMIRDPWGNAWQIATHGGRFTPGS